MVLDYRPGWLAPAEADVLLPALSSEIPWEQHHVRLFGRTLPAPRLSCWIGDPDAAYTYSAVRFEPRPWTPQLAALRDRLNVAFGAGFNSVLANRYRNGADGMGWHSDDEPELGPQPLIASLSLGAPRRFLLRERGGPWRGEILLEHGSLLRMAGASQARTQHSLPKTARPVAERLNLTFRQIAAPSPPPRRRSRQAGAG